MDVKDTEERMIIAKPIASRPSCSKFQSFSSLLSDNSPPGSLLETAVAAIRPRTVRLKPTVSWSSTAVVSSQGEASGTAACCSSDKFLQSETKSSVVYKPLARLVSRTTVTLLANMGNSDINRQQPTEQVQTHVHNPSQAYHHFQTPMPSDYYRQLPSPMRINQIIDSSKMVSRRVEEIQKALLPTASGDRPSYDGYNWRKYGQKQVKGSEYPRSYYKCTHPNCPVKKKVERSLDGQIAEIVYKGEHNHPKPQPPKRHSSGAQEQVVVSDGIGQQIGNPLLCNSFSERNEVSEGRIEHHNRLGLSMNPYSGKAPMTFDSFTTGTFTSSLGTPDNSCGLSGEYDEGSRRLEPDDDEPKYKRRKTENQPPSEVNILPQGVREPRIIVQGATDAEIVGDGFRWRKYGQKVVKGNPYPRSYYRCSSLKCNVRKHVERSLDDPSAFITTYEGKHNHEMPAAKNTNHSVASDPSSTTPSNKSKP